MPTSSTSATSSACAPARKSRYGVVTSSLKLKRHFMRDRLSTAGPGAADRLVARGAVSDRSLSSSQAGDRDPERAARHVVQAQLVAEVDRVGVAAVLPADPDLHLRPGLAALGDRNLHHPAHPRPVAP